jgi:putative endonuclease
VKSTARGTARRRQAERRGRIAELLCRWHLRLRGWRILAHHWRCASGEIDIVARRGGTLAVIEVKSRRDLASAATALVPRQRRRIVRATEAFLLTRPDLAELGIRFDVILVEGWRPARHLAGAWRSDE